MTPLSLQAYLEGLLNGEKNQSPLQALGENVSYTLFFRDQKGFQVLAKSGYPNSDFFYSFLENEPSVLSPLLDSSHIILPAKLSSCKECIFWAITDHLVNPKNLLLIELPLGSNINGSILQMILSFELLFRQNVKTLNETSIDIPIWLEEALPSFMGKVSPILVVAEAGSGKEELVHSFLRKRYGNLETAVFFHPGRLSQAVQLRELFGDPAGARLGHLSASIPIVNRSEPVIVIQEAGDLDRLAQLRLLALFSANESNKLWIFETSRDLKKMAMADQFLLGLSELLQKNIITLPPLRNCLNELPKEVERLMNNFRQHYHRNVQLSQDTIETLLNYSWPGNWRELKNTLESAFLMAKENVIHSKDLRLGRWAVPEDWDDLNLRKHSEAMEKTLLLRAYSLHSGNQVQMANALGISRGSLQYKLGKYNLN